MKKFEFREGYRGKGSPQAIGEELERIRKAKGLLTPEAVIEEAKKKSSPLHEEFEWNDSLAAERYRLVQARTLIRAITVIVKDDAPPVSQYVHVTVGKTRSYEPMEVAVQSVDLYHSALEQLEEKLSGAVRAVQELREAAGSSRYRGKLAIIGLVSKALEAAVQGIKKLAA
jgi:hypothetical protein